MLLLIRFYHFSLLVATPALLITFSPANSISNSICSPPWLEFLLLYPFSFALKSPPTIMSWLSKWSLSVTQVAEKKSSIVASPALSLGAYTPIIHSSFHIILIILPVSTSIFVIGSTYTWFKIEFFTNTPIPPLRFERA